MSSSADHGDVPFSVILVHSAPGTGPKLHRLPYAEVFFMDSGEATFQLVDESIVVNGVRWWWGRRTSLMGSPTHGPATSV
jgi:hypothetical protein